MPDPEFREARPEDTDELLRVRNQIFPPLSKEKWLAAKRTAAVAFHDGKMVGAIPRNAGFRMTSTNARPAAFYSVLLSGSGALPQCKPTTMTNAMRNMRATRIFIRY